MESLQTQKQALEEELTAAQAHRQEERTSYDKELEVRRTQCYFNSQLTVIPRGSKNVMSVCWRITRSLFGKRSVFDQCPYWLPLDAETCVTRSECWKGK